MGEMKALIFSLVAAVICIQCNGQFTDTCLPQRMREVPVTLQIKNAPDLSACNDDGLLAIPDLAALAEEQIINQYHQSYDCRLTNVRHIACRNETKDGHKVLRYIVNLTCGDECYHLALHDQNNRDARRFFANQANSQLRDAYRMQPKSNFSYNDKLIEILYFKGRKGGLHFMCSGNMIQNGVNKRIPACSCPSSCTSPCELPPETGRCRGYFPHYYHNATSGQCERFIYGGCEGNRNRFTTQEECETVCRVCPEGMAYQECGTSCPTTCDKKDDIFPCTLECVQGCFCKEGTVLLEEGGEVCVAPEKCPVTGSGQCPEGMVYKECGTACPTTCDNKDELVICTLQCVPGCFCSEGTVLLEAGGEECVASDKCPTTQGN